MNDSSRRLSAVAALALLLASPLFAADGDGQTYEWLHMLLNPECLDERPKVLAGWNAPVQEPA